MAKKNIVRIVVVVCILVGAAALYFVFRGGLTDKQRFENCMETCYEVVLSDSSKQYCPEQCTKNTGYQPTGPEIMDIIANINHTAATTKTVQPATNTAVNTNHSANTNTQRTTNAVLNPNAAPGTQYYCNWVWPQEVIDYISKEVVTKCSDERPWCNYGDYTYETAGCCTDAAHTDCVTLPNL
ncbi:MAG: hypothetical protein PHY34_05230 [Patescibacteria group bacterium]|nr:hypothetical protein [Patescibacteria group bacterium]MDD5715746.1 hypothetical protein [Patescibacteria group bacterium]